MDGIEAARIICDDPNLSTKVLILATFDLDEYVSAAMRAGAGGFLLKDTPAREVADAVRVIDEGNALFAQHRAREAVSDPSCLPNSTANRDG